MGSEDQQAIYKGITGKLWAQEIHLKNKLLNSY